MILATYGHSHSSLRVTFHVIAVPIKRTVKNSRDLNPINEVWHEEIFYLKTFPVRRFVYVQHNFNVV
jgi:hypothetical protein